MSRSIADRGLDDLNNNLSIDEILSRLVIVAAFQRDRLDEWTAAVRDHRSARVAICVGAVRDARNSGTGLHITN
jgi:hypothetical protein